MAVSRDGSFGFWAVVVAVVAAAAVIALVAGVAATLWTGPSTIELPVPVQRDSVLQRLPVPAPLAAVPSVTVPPPAEVAAAAPPPGVSADDWRKLQAELAQRPDELQRLNDYFVFADQAQRFRALDRPAPGQPAAHAERLALARALDAGLDQRLRQREVNAAEARLIKIAVLDVLVDGDAPRRQALAAWEADVAQAASPLAAETAAASNAQFQRRQAEIVAAWSATPADQRDPRELERRLDALRVEHFARAR